MDEHTKSRIGLRRIARWLALSSVGMIAVSTLGTWASVGSTVAEAQLPGWFTKTFVLEAVTDGDGRFAVSHGLVQGCSGDQIHGVTVAVQSRADGRFYGGAPWAEGHITYSWNDREISGRVASDPAFNDARVRIVAFTARRIC